MVLTNLAINRHLHQNSSLLMELEDWNTLNDGFKEEITLHSSERGAIWNQDKDRAVKDLPRI